MAFKSVEQFNEDRYRGKFILEDDGKSADVIFLFRSKADMLQADAHYIKSSDYSGYVHCCGKGCPACALKKPDGSLLIRLQSKLFIPLYNIEKDEIEFWDRNMTFEQQFSKAVFEHYANPSEYVFKITRHGEYKDINTRYDIVAVGKNVVATYDQILAKFNAKMPDYYETIIKEYSISELTEILNSQDSAPMVEQDYIPVPRTGYQSSVPDTYVNTSDVVGDNSDSINSEDIIEPSANGDLPDPIF